MKRTFIAILLALSLATVIGCKSDDVDYYLPNVLLKSSNFNLESYVWESLYFPTNRTTGAQ